MEIERFNIGKIRISDINLPKALDIIENTLRQNQLGYICVTNSRTTHLANINESYCEIQNNSLLTIPDGMPLVWIAHNSGFKNVGRVSGPDLIEAVFKISREKNYSHYFYGSTPKTIFRMQSNLQKRFPGLEIKGAFSPPFQPLEKFDIDSLAKEINRLKPTFFWCGLGAPKQERLIALLQPKLDSTISLGVGLAFEYLGGTVKRAPLWMQKTGLEWLYRLAQQPKNIKRAIQPFSWIILRTLLSFRDKHVNRKSN